MLPVPPGPTEFNGRSHPLIDRRGFLAAAVTLMARVAAEAQAGKVHRVALILNASLVSEMAGPDPRHSPTRALLHGLRALGYVEGQNLVFERRSAEGRPGQVRSIVVDLVRLGVDVIVTIGDPMTADARQVAPGVPLVMTATFDPVGAGLVQSLARPGGSVTGLTWAAGPEFEAKRLELLKEAAPRVTRVAFLGLKGDWNNPAGQAVQAAAPRLGVVLLHAEHPLNDYTRAFAHLSQSRPDALFVGFNASNWAHRRLIADFALRNRLPSVHNFRDSVQVGGLMAYGVNPLHVYRRAADYVDRLLRGARPADLPVEQPTTFELVINLRTAKALGLTIPTSVLARADEVIE